MPETKTILTSIEGPVATITLNRPAVHHAINLEMIRELTEALSRFDKEPDISIILLRSTGEHFCAGADLNWMKEGMKQRESQLKKESMELASLFSLMTRVSAIILTAVSGKVVGGANGLVAASDLVIADESTRFAFSEVKLGLIPATIAPYVVRRLGKSKAAAWMLTGRWFSSEEAKCAGLVDFSCKKGKLEEECSKVLKDLRSGGPEALAGIKDMLHNFDFDMDADRIIEKSAGILARLRISSEGQEGMKAFLEKRRPRWNEK
ncbi:MAG: enoyl-CoA hydratase-related protein [Bacteroides sp.]|nr:enoyl-CoA hydratase-related protein [Bacteroides sp.]